MIIRKITKVFEAEEVYGNDGSNLKYIAERVEFMLSLGQNCFVIVLLIYYKTESRTQKDALK